MKNFIIASIFFNPMIVNALELVDRIIAVVNNDAVLFSDTKLLQSRIQSGSPVHEMLLTDGNPQTLLNSKNLLVEYLISEKIIDGEIKRLNLTVTMDRVQQEIREIARQNKITSDELISTLKKQGIDIANYQSFMKSNIEWKSLMESEISSKIHISDSDVASEYFNTHKASETSEAEYGVSHIFFNVQRGGEAKAKDRSNQAMEKLNSGLTFDSVAEQFSEDKNFTAGGWLGSFSSKELPSEMAQAIKPLEINGYSGVVKTKNGLHIFKLVSKKLVNDPIFEKEKEKIRSRLFEAAFKKQFQIWAERKREDSFIRINEST
jgi:parvulin-like peptidyl-prolyl isomerase